MIVLSEGTGQKEKVRNLSLECGSDGSPCINLQEAQTAVGPTEEMGKEVTNCRESIEFPNPGLHSAPTLTVEGGAYSSWGTNPVQERAGLEEGSTDRPKL